MPGSRSRSRYATNIWPGFVDALATLLLAIIFLLMIFVVAQFFLSEALTGRDQALQRLEGQIGELGELLALERKANTDLRTDMERLSEELQASIRSRDDLAGTVRDLTLRAEDAEARTVQLQEELEESFKVIDADKEKIRLHLQRIADLSQEVAALTALRDELQEEIKAAAGKLEETEGKLVEEKNISESARAQIALLNQQMGALREQMAELTAALDKAEKKAAEQNVQIESLGKRLNAALASKVAQLARYRSEFFGRLRDVLGKAKGVRIVGDRFVFQSEVLFATGSAVLGKPGRDQLASLATTLKNMMAKIPDDIDWVLRVDGHTDRIPIRTERFPSNWELSAARAISVVKYLIAKGIPPKRLVAAGFGQQHPIDTAKTKAALERNRRIEFKLTQR